MDIYAISDLEGFHPRQLISNYDNIIKTNEVIICGDVLDSTMLSKDHLNDKSNNLKTIYEIVNQPNLKLTFGNRDLNKMKVKPLTILKTKDNSNNVLVQKFNDGKLDTDFVESYNSLLQIESNIEWVHKMSNWYPFWGGIDKNIAYWKDDNQPTELKDNQGVIIRKFGFFEKRFQKIFGADTTVGTMSAGFLLETIPKELKLNLYKDAESKVIDYNFNAFVVLAVFKSMLIKDTEKNEELGKFFSGQNIKLNQSHFRGLLYKMFTNPKNNMIIIKCNCEEKICKCTNDKNMHLFSHGGVSNNIINRTNILNELHQELIKSGSLTSKLTNANNILKGGYYVKKDQSTLLTSIQIENKIVIFNQKIKDTIEAIFTENNTKEPLMPSNNMLLLLISTATFDCKIFGRKIGVSEMCNNLDLLNTSSDLISTMAGIKSLRKEKSVFFKRGNIYNIFGHSPNGFCSTIDLFENYSSKTYLINLDTSNTFFSTAANQKTENTSSYIKINKSGIYVKSNINIKYKPEQELINADPINYLRNDDDKDNKNIKIISFINQETKDLLTSNDVININIDTLINDDFDLEKHIKQIGENENVFYHGYFSKNTVKYILLTYHRVFGSPFPKCLVILSETDFNRLFPPQKGGNYLNKYLKYKQKYISLKNNIGL
jgi:hypothetical protein